MDKPLPHVKKSLDVEDGTPGLSRLGRFLLDQLYPPNCLHCDAPVARADALCPSCWRQLRPITAPLCPVLGLPFEVPLGPEARSAEAIANPPPFDRARSAYVYTDIARSIVSRLKYGDKPQLAGFCAQAMLTAAPDVFSNDCVLVPVPLHRGRQWRRRYNQSTEICRALSALTGLETVPLLVERKRPTRQQVGLSAEQRARNVAGAFKVRAEIAENFAGCRVVIVDDVITTGATIYALARCLRRAGFEHIDVISFARVVIGAELTI